MPQVKLLKCVVDGIVVDISFNQLGGMLTLAFLEEVGGAPLHPTRARCPPMQARVALHASTPQLQAAPCPPAALAFAVRLFWPLAFLIF